MNEKLLTLFAAELYELSSNISITAQALAEGAINQAEVFGGFGLKILGYSKIYDIIETAFLSLIC